MPQKPKPCRWCRNQRYAQVAAAVERGVPVSTAARAAGIHRVNVHKHVDRCPAFRRRYEQARKQGRARLSRQGRRAATDVAVSRAAPIIVAAIAAGKSRADAARAAGVNVNTANSWYRRRPDFRADVDAAQQEAAQA